MQSHLAMREYLLLLMIACFGIGGLFSIHREVQLREKWEANYLLDDTFRISTVEPVAVDSEVLSGVINPHEELAVQFMISDFDEGSQYYVDNGRDVKIQVDSSDFLLRFEEVGDYMVKLIKNDILVDATLIRVNQNEEGKNLVSF